MRQADWHRRFFASTRGRVLRLLGEAKRTVTELSQILRLTDNAVRAHLAALERDGLVRRAGLRRATRKPNFAYELTAAGHQFFPKFHGALLLEFLDVVRDELSQQELENLIRKTALRLVRKYLPDIDKLPPEQRVVRVLDGLKLSGLLAGVEKLENHVLVRGCSCPIGEVVVSHPELCHIAAEVIGGVLGRQVVDRCDRSAAPRCNFQIATTP
jgi:predicted ArsR family transcriptional regulator